MILPVEVLQAVLTTSVCFITNKCDMLFSCFFLLFLKRLSYCYGYKIQAAGFCLGFLFVYNTIGSCSRLFFLVGDTERYACRQMERERSLINGLMQKIIFYCHFWWCFFPFFFFSSLNKREKKGNERNANSYFSISLAGNDYNDGSHTHHHQAPNGNGPAPPDLRQTHNFYPTFPASATANGMVSAGIPSTDGHLSHVSAHPPPSHHASAVTAAASKQEDEDTSALFGDLPEAKRRKFILVDDTQRGTRVRVRVMLDQVKMAEMPDSYRKSNSVYPRSWFPTEMQSPPPSPRRGRWPEDAEDSETTVQTLVPVPVIDGSETKLAVPRMTRTKRNKEVMLNDLGYRMSWSQSRVFSGRTLFLQRSRKFFDGVKLLFLTQISGCISQQDEEHNGCCWSGCYYHCSSFRDQSRQTQVVGQNKEKQARFLAIKFGQWHGQSRP
jgi:hypothetical protein